MKNEKENITQRNMDEMVRLGSAELTYNQIQDYLARGRYLQSAFVADLLNGLWRNLKAGYLGITKSFVTGSGKIHAVVKILFYDFLRYVNKRSSCMRNKAKCRPGLT